jgi:hypothetical protein
MGRGSKGKGSERRLTDDIFLFLVHRLSTLALICPLCVFVSLRLKFAAQLRSLVSLWFKKSAGNPKSAFRNRKSYIKCPWSICANRRNLRKTPSLSVFRNPKSESRDPKSPRFRFPLLSRRSPAKADCPLCGSFQSDTHLLSAIFHLHFRSPPHPPVYGICHNPATGLE